MNEQQIDLLLDAVTTRQISRTEAEQQLQQAGVAAAASLIDAHLQATQLVQQYATLQAISKVRQSFEAEKQTQRKTAAPVRTITMRHWLSAAAAIIVLPLLYFSLQLSMYSKADMMQDMQATYSINTPRGEQLLLIDSMLQAFNQQQFAAVITQFNRLKQPSVREQFLAGYAYQQTGNYTASAALLDTLLQQNKQQQETLYYLAMACIELQHYDKAYSLMKNIQANEQHTYHEKANRKLIWKLWWLK
jgi:alpha-D-ribose 1-methylphosphonate 5-triphosphate synthase subunit PhnG